MHLSKHHGLGNDFLIVLDERNDRPVSIDANLARYLCDRRLGLGADGLIHGVAPSPEQARAGIDVVMALFNSDGSTAEISGNGIRCLAQAVARTRPPGLTCVEIFTAVGSRRLEIVGPAHHQPGDQPGDQHGANLGDHPTNQRAESSADQIEISVQMGRASAGPHVPAPVAETLPERFATADLGNPHLVLLVDNPADVDLATEGAWLEQQFESGINVEYVSVGSDRSSLTMRVWERGAGITQACGTGACAAAFVAHGWGLVGDRVRVVMPGGGAVVVLGDNDNVELIGPAAFVADITIPDPQPQPQPQPKSNW